MKVLFLNDLADPRIGSSVRQMYQHARVLRAGGHETALLTAVQDPAQVGETQILGMRVVRVLSDYPVRFRSWVSLDNGRVREPVAKLLADFRPDVVHSHLIHSHLGYATLTAARKAGAGVVFTAHDVMTFCYQKLTCFHGGEAKGGEENDVVARTSKCLPCQRLRFRPGRNAAIRKVLGRDVHRFTAVSDALAEVLRANRVHVDRRVWNAIEPQPSLPAKVDVEGFRKARGLEEAQLIAIGGRLHEQKGVFQLLRMMQHLKDRFPRLQLLVMGKRDVYDREFAAAASELGVADRVVPTGWLDGDELQAAYASLDVFVTPSICFDTFGLVNLEAMEHGKPVVATTFGGSREVVEHGVTGFIENPFQIEAFANRVGELLADGDRARSMGEAGRARMQKLFRIERLAAEFDEVYREAIAAASRAPQNAS